MQKAITILLGLALILSVVAGCEENVYNDPKKVVISLFGAMEKNDQARVAHLLDLPALMKNSEQDYAIQTDNPRVFTNPRDVLEDLTNDGKTKQRWFAYQRIVSQAQIMGDDATVEVTFVDKEASKGYMTKFGLHKVNDQWRIYSFKTFDQGS